MKRYILLTLVLTVIVIGPFAYQKWSEAKRLQLEQDETNSYIGSQACQECHQKEFSQWSHSSHVTAFNTLRTVGREYYPECVTCYVTGSGYESGYQIGNPKRERTLLTTPADYALPATPFQVM